MSRQCVLLTLDALNHGVLPTLLLGLYHLVVEDECYLLEPSWNDYPLSFFLNEC